VSTIKSKKMNGVDIHSPLHVALHCLQLNPEIRLADGEGTGRCLTLTFLYTQIDTNSLKYTFYLNYKIIFCEMHCNIWCENLEKEVYRETTIYIDIILSVVHVTFIKNLLVRHLVYFRCTGIENIILVYNSCFYTI